MATLRQVLDHFERQSGAVSLATMARELGVEAPMLQEMITYWVRKGRLRQVNDAACNSTCVSNCARGCPFVFALPAAYELVPVEAVSTPAPKCPHCH
jgi:hypothetical protein